MTEHDDSVWKVIPEFAATYYGDLSEFPNRMSVWRQTSLLDNLPPFYHTLLKYWQEYNHDEFSEDPDTVEPQFNSW